MFQRKMLMKEVRLQMWPQKWLQKLLQMSVFEVFEALCGYSFGWTTRVWVVFEQFVDCYLFGFGQCLLMYHEESARLDVVI